MYIHVHVHEYTATVVDSTLLCSIVQTSDVQYVSIYRNIDIFVEYRDTLLAFGCIDTLE